MTLVIPVRSPASNPPPVPVGSLAYDPFPRTAWYAIAPGSGSGTSYAYANSTFQANAAKFNIVIVGAYPGIEQTMGNTTLATIFGNIKSAGASLLPKNHCGIYVMSSEQSTVGGGGNASGYTVWSSAVNTANWWIRTSYPSGTIVTHDANSGDIAITSQNTITDSNGRTISQGFWNHYDNVLRQGNAVAQGYASNLAFAANANLDLYFLDNTFCQPREAGAWGMNTTSYAAGNATAAMWMQEGQAAQVAAIRAINPNLQIIGNCDYYVHATTVFSTQTALDSTQSALWDGTLVEQGIGASFSLEGQGSTTTAQFIANLIASEAQIDANGTMILQQTGRARGTNFTSTSQASWVAADWQAARFGLAIACLRNYHFDLTPTEITSPASAFFMDETLAQAGVMGWLGNSWVADATQSAPRSGASGCWVREFYGGNGSPGGLVLMNPAGNGTQTLTLSTLGFTGNSWRACSSNGYGDNTVNTGTSVTSVTLPARSAQFLVRTS